MRLYQRFLPYGVAIGLSAIALLLTFCLEPLMPRTTGTFFYITIIFSSWYGGFKPGVVAVVLSTLALNYFFTHPQHQLSLGQPDDILRLGLFLVVALAINSIAANLQESKKKIEKLNQQLIAEKSQQLGLALSAARMGMWNWNLVTGEIKWSPEHALLLGLSPDAFDGKYETFEARIHPEDRQGLNQAVQQALKTQSIYQHEFRIIWPDGSIHWVEGRGQGFYDAAGEAVRMTGTIMNIDDRKQAETLLPQQFQQQQILMEMSQRIRQSLNLQDILQTTVEEMRRFLQCDRVIVLQFSPGWAASVVVESVGDDWMALLPLQIYDSCIGEESIASLKRGVVTAKSDLSNSGLSPCHIKFLANFQVKANLVAPILMGDELWGLLAAHHCASPRQWQDYEIELIRQVAIQAGVAIQQADLFEQVQKEALRIQTLFNTSFDGIVILDEEGKVLDANPRFYQMLGYTREEAASLSIFDWEANYTSEQVQQLMRDFINVKSGVMETRHRRKDGSIFDVEISANLVESQGEILQFCVCRDITDRKQAQVALQQLNAELEQRVIERTAEVTSVNNRLQQELLQGEILQRELFQREQLLDGFFNAAASANIGLSIHDRDIRYLKLNQALADINSLPIEAHWGKTCNEITPEIAKTLVPMLQNVIDTRIAICNLEVSEITPSQPELLRYWLVSAFPILGETEQTIAVGAMVVEITERKRIEEALKLSEEKYRQIVDTANEGIWVIDNQANTSFVNPQMAEMLGYSSAEMLGKSLFYFMDQEAQAIASALMEGRRQGITEQHDFKFRRQDGSDLWCLIGTSPILDRAGQFIGALGMVTDISHRKQAEQALRESEEKFRQLAENIQALLWIKDLQNQQIVYLSNAYETIWQRKREDVSQNFSSWLDAVHPDDRQLLETAFIEQKRTGHSDTEYRIIRPDGLLRWIRDRAFPIKDESGKIWRIAGIAEDITDSKQTEEALRQSESILRSFFNSGSMMMGIVEIYPHDIFHLSTNIATTEFFGTTPDAMQNCFASEIGTSQEFIEMWLHYYREAEVTGAPVKFEYKYQTAKTQKWLCATTCSIVNSSSNKSRFSFVVEDITDRKQAEAALLQKSRQEQLLWCVTQAIRQSLDLNAILNTAVTEVRQTLQVDRAAVYRFNPDWNGDFVMESVGENWVKLVGCYHPKIWEYTYLQNTPGGRLRNNETFVIDDIYNAGLQPCHIEILEQFQARAYIIVPIFSGENLWGLLAIYQNATLRNWESWEVELLEQIASQLAIAIQQSELYGQLQIELQERSHAAATIREAERRWRSLLDNVQLIVVGLDRSGNVNYVNHFFLKVTEYTNSEVLGKNWFKNFLPQSSQQSSQTIFSEVLQHNTHPYYRNAILTKTGEERFIAWNNTILQDSEGNIIGTISIGEDITERQKIEQIKDEFIGIVSHELRTPLTAIQMSLGLLKTGIYDKKPEKSRRMIEIALLDTNRLVNLVNDILDLERLQSGRAFLQKTLCKAADLMQQAVDGIQGLATQQQILLIVTPTDAEVWATGDAILQVLTNLLSNAIKFSPADSTIHLSAENQKDFVLFQVSDRGRGIPADKLELIFGRFHQVDASDSREKGGTGLGLAICQSIIEQHGGKIWAESILGEGSRFFFTLPLPSDIVV